MNRSQLSPHIASGALALRLIAAALLLWACVPSNPYGYYILLRWIVCPIFTYLAWSTFTAGRSPWIWSLAVNAGIYNPVFPVHLGRTIWTAVNIASVALLVISFFAGKRPGQERT